MKIESFDPYHIGIKLNNVNFQIFRQKIIKTMKSLEMPISAKDEMPFNVPIEILTSDGETRIELNYSSLAINTIGNDPHKTNELFSKLTKVLTTIGYELDSLVIFYEVQTNINIKLDTSPLELVSKSVSCNLESWKELHSGVSVNGIKIELVDNELGAQSLAIVVYPNPIRPKHYLLVSVRYQHIEDDKIIDFGNKIEKRVLNLIGSLGKKNA